jgi:hypothetical protein
VQAFQEQDGVEKFLVALLVTVIRRKNSPGKSLHGNSHMATCRKIAENWTEPPLRMRLAVKIMAFGMD